MYKQNEGMLIQPKFNKNKTITIRLTANDIALLYKVSMFLEMDRSDLVRMYIRKNNSYYGKLMLQNTDINKVGGYDKDFLQFGYIPQDKNKEE